MRLFFFSQGIFFFHRAFLNNFRLHTWSSLSDDCTHSALPLHCEALGLSLLRIQPPRIAPFLNSLFVRSSAECATSPAFASSVKNASGFYNEHSPGAFVTYA